MAFGINTFQRRFAFSKVKLAKESLSMANVKAALYRYCRTASGWRRFRTNPVRKGRGWDERIEVPSGQRILERGEYQLRWYEGDRSIFNGVGKDLQEAITSRYNQVCSRGATGRSRYGS
jgi:hypothetical protein